MDSILKIIADNPALTEALRKVIEDEFEVTTITLSKVENLSDENLGQAVRAQITGMKAINEAFKKIAQYKTNPERIAERNPAR